MHSFLFLDRGRDWENVCVLTMLNGADQTFTQTRFGLGHHVYNIMTMRVMTRNIPTFAFNHFNYRLGTAQRLHSMQSLTRTPELLCHSAVQFLQTMHPNPLSEQRAMQGAKCWHDA